MSEQAAVNKAQGKINVQTREHIELIERDLKTVMEATGGFITKATEMIDGLNKRLARLESPE